VSEGHDRARESHLRRFTQAQRSLTRTSNLPRKSDLTEYRGSLPDRTVAHARRDRADHSEVGGRFDDGHAAGEIDEDVLAHPFQAGALLENGEQQRQAILVDPAGHPPSVAVRAGADERL